MKRFLAVLFMLIILTGCVHTPEPEPTTEQTVAIETEPTVVVDPLVRILEDMTIKEKVGQLFLVAAPSQDILEQIDTYHFGGIILFADDVEGHTPTTLRQWISKIQDHADIPLLVAVDEEGGTVCRISSDSDFAESRFPSPRKLYNEGGLDLLLETEAEKSDLLSGLGINVNLAPVCDITTDQNAFMYSRSLGLSPEKTSECIGAMVKTMTEHEVGSVLKHFPGYGNNTDTHVAMAIDNRTLAQLESADLVPFQGGIDAGCGGIMVSHTIITALDSEYPATLSPAVIKYLREDMNFEGVIITDDLEMDAITDHFGRGESAVLAVLAGNDILCTWTYEEQFNAVFDAVLEGRITMEQLDSAVMRILRWKQQLNIL